MLALELLFSGPAAPRPGIQRIGQCLPMPAAPVPRAGGGTVDLGREWLRSIGGVAKVKVETDGFRSQIIALAAAAIQPELFSVVDSHNTIHSLAFLFETPVPIRSAPELFCLDLYEYYDVDMLEAMASPVKITWSQAASAAGPWKLKRYSP